MCPALNADFFTQLQRVQPENLQPEVDAVMKDVIESFGANFKLTLEEYFTHIEALLKGGALLAPSSKKYSPARLKDKRRHLLNGLAAVLEEPDVRLHASCTPSERRPGAHPRSAGPPAREHLRNRWFTAQVATVGEPPMAASGQILMAAHTLPW